MRRPTERTTRPMSRVVAHGSRRIELGVHTLPACSDGRGRSIHHCMIDGLARCAALAVVRLPRIATGGTLPLAQSRVRVQGGDIPESEPPQLQPAGSRLYRVGAVTLPCKPDRLSNPPSPRSPPG